MSNGEKHRNAGNGYLAKNDYKKSAAQPEYTGKLKVDDVDVRIAAWVREKDGRRYFSLKASVLDNQPYPGGDRTEQGMGEYAKQKAVHDEPDDDIPF